MEHENVEETAVPETMGDEVNQEEQDENFMDIFGNKQLTKKVGYKSFLEISKIIKIHLFLGDKKGRTRQSTREQIYL